MSKRRQPKFNYILRHPGNEQDGTFKALYADQAREANDAARQSGENRLWIRQTPYYREYLETHGTAEELRPILGENWGICRKTPNNLERYARCITRKEYADANKLAISRRIGSTV